MAFSEYTDEQLNQLINDGLVEQERRRNQAAIPTMIYDLAAKYVADGGNISDITLG